MQHGLIASKAGMPKALVTLMENGRLVPAGQKQRPVPHTCMIVSRRTKLCAICGAHGPYSVAALADMPVLPVMLAGAGGLMLNSQAALDPAQSH